jgi:hypothetical protein
MKNGERIKEKDKRLEVGGALRLRFEAKKNAESRRLEATADNSQCARIVTLKQARVLLLLIRTPGRKGKLHRLSSFWRRPESRTIHSGLQPTLE